MIDDGVACAIVVVTPPPEGELPRKFESPEYVPEIVCEPAVRMTFDIVAVPDVSVGHCGSDVTPQRAAPLSVNCTVPVGDPVPFVTVTVAVNVSGCPKEVPLDGDTVTEVVVVPLVIVIEPVNCAVAVAAKLVRGSR